MKDNNPYASPNSEVLEAPSTSESTRRIHLNYEANVKALGSLYYLNFSLITLSALLALSGDVNFDSGLSEGLQVSGLLVAALLACLAIVFFLLARGLRSFRPWSRAAAIGFSLLGLIAFPIGTIFNIIILYLLLSRKGTFVFTPEYKTVLADTPYIKYKTSIVVWIAMGLMILVLLMIMMSAIFSS